MFTLVCGSEPATAIAFRREDRTRVVWHNKLQPSPHTRYSVREIARSLGESPDAVMKVLSDLGEYVDSAAKKMIEEPVRKSVYERMGYPYEPPAVQPVTPWERRDLQPPKRLAPKSRDRNQPQKRPAMRGQLPQQSSHSVERTFPPKDVSSRIGDPAEDASPAMAQEFWKLYGFTDTERKAWCEHLDYTQPKVAARLRDAGLMPQDLSVNLQGWSVYKRLCSGESPAEAKRMLDRSRKFV